MSKMTLNIWLWLLIGASVVLTGVLLVPRFFSVTASGVLHPTVAQMRSDDLGLEVEKGVSVFPGLGDKALRYHALVIGVNRYQDHEEGGGWSDLKTARFDAERIGEVLEMEYGFDVTRLLDDGATYSDMMTAMDRLSRMGEHDAVLIYFAGHGYYDQVLGEGYWIPSDARKRVDGRPAREDWVWNSTLSKMLQASDARHILVMADSCYSGSLLRGESALPSHVDMDYYSRAIQQSSRYVISSGDLEPVLDSGEGHSFFAAHVLEMLEDSRAGVFAGSDIARRLKGAVKASTGQRVRFGALFEEGAGELVLVRRNVDAAARAALYENQDVDDAVRFSEQVMLADAALMYRQGALQSAHHLADKLGVAGLALFRGEGAGVSFSYRSGVDELIDLLSRQEKGVNRSMTRPRVLANLGIQVVGEGHDDVGLAALIEMGLDRLLLKEGRVRVVNRAFLEEALREQRLGVTLSDPEARVEVGKLLPASILLSGRFVRTSAGSQLFVQLIDTRTTELFASFSHVFEADEGVLEVVEALAKEVTEALIDKRPLRAAVLSVKNRSDVSVGMGAFHGASSNMVLQVVERTVGGDGEVRERLVGSAEVKRVGEFSSEVRLGSLRADAGDVSRWWVVEGL